MRRCGRDWRRLAAAAALALLAVAHAHEAVPVVLFGHGFDFSSEREAEHRHSAPREPDSPKSSCALCVLVGTAALASPVETVGLPAASPGRALPVADETSFVAHTPWSPVSRRGPPVLSF